MKIENQVVNFELSKKIEKLGVDQDSQWYWILCKHNNKTFLLNCDDRQLDRNYRHPDAEEFYEVYSAFTVAELGELLKHPNQEILSYHPNTPPIWSGTNWILYRDGKIILEANTEADGRAKMLIRLIENKLKTECGKNTPN